MVNSMKQHTLFYILLLILGFETSCHKPVVDMNPTPKLASLQITCESATIPKNVNFPCTATGTYTDNSTAKVTDQAQWEVNDQAIVSFVIPASSQMRGLTQGSTKITATIGAVQGEYLITVTNATPSALTVAPNDKAFRVGEKQQYTAVCIFSDNSFIDVTNNTTWTTQNPTVASITSGSTTGALLTALTSGTTNVVANFSGLQTSTRVSVLGKELLTLRITPRSASVIKNLTKNYSLTGIYTDFTTVDLTSQATWSVVDGTIASISNTTASAGTLTGLQLGNTNVTAMYGSLTDTTDVTIINATLNSVAITPSNPSVAKGLTQQLTVTGTYSDGSSVDLTQLATWSSSNASVISVNNSTSKGLMTGVNTGSANVTATYNSTSDQTAGTVTTAVLSTVSLTPSTPTLTLGGTQAMTATGVYSDSSTIDLTASLNWSSSDSSKVTVGNSGGTKGQITAVAIGAATVTATNGSTTGQTSVVVAAASLNSITITPNNPSVAKGLTKQFTATGSYSDSTSADITTSVTWASSSTSVATISNTSGSKGLASSQGTGSTTISATSGSVSGQTTLTVTSPTLLSISVTPSAPSCPLGTIQVLTAIGTYTDGSTQDITASVTWNSSDLVKATVSNTVGSKGQVSPLALGNATVTATLSGVSGQSSISVVAASLLSITVTPGVPNVAKGLTQQFVATGHYSDGSTQDITSSVTWSSGSTSIATVSNTAGSRGLVATLGIGSSTITATLGSISGQTSCSVAPANLVSITVTPANSSISILQVKQFTATGTYTDGTTQDLTTSVTWSSSNALTATISNAGGNQGKASGVGIGSSTITATYGSIVGSTQLSGIL